MPISKAPAVFSVSNDTLAELGNWAIAHDQLPKQQLEKFAEQYPVLTWRPGVRPLQIDAFCTKSPCGQFRIGATPVANSNDESVTVGIVDGVVEQVAGSVLFEALAWSKSVFAGTIEKTKTVASSTAVSLGGHRLLITVADLRLEDQRTSVALGISKASKDGQVAPALSLR
jgi:hypothetical protein